MVYNVVKFFYQSQNLKPKKQKQKSNKFDEFHVSQKIIEWEHAIKMINKPFISQSISAK